jgi:eukaryotic-like serine/threonine-protein kinase
MQLRPDLRQELQHSLGSAFEIERELGGGGMSRVFVAHERALDRRVVVKVLPPELAGMNVERFRREIHLSAQLSHPHIVPVHSSGEMNGIPYYTMPFIDGRSLRSRLESGERISLSDAMKILHDVAGALSFAHAHGVVHRDIKPDNILMSAGHAVVMDFGVAKAVSAANVLDGRSSVLETGAGVAIGTPAYMAPEQAAGDPGTDHRADIYSFGLLAFELLAGRGPFGRRPPHEMLTAQVAERPPHIRQLNPEISDRLATLVMSCLEKQPAKRPDSADYLLRELEAITTSGSASAVIPFAFKGWQRAAAAVVAVAGLGVVLTGLFQPADSASNDIVAVAPFRVQTDDASLRYLGEGMLDLLSTKLTGSGGPRSADPREVLSAWRRAAGSDTAALDRARALQVAEGLGAGHLLLGDIGGNAGRLVLTAVLVRVRDGRAEGQARAEGPADSLATLVDQLTAQLLAHGAGEGERLASLTSTSLDAVRAYLDGQSLYRRAHYAEAATKFETALQIDSTFGLAGLGLASAASWYGDPKLRARGVEIAWRGRSRMSLRDQALVDVRAGRNYPAPEAASDWLKAQERYLSLAPERAEAWFELGDGLFHSGLAVGRADAHQRAAEAFRRTLALDSAFLPAAEHLLILAAVARDTSEVRRIAELYLRADPNNENSDGVRWILASVVGDRRLRERALARRDSMSLISLHTIQSVAQLAALDLPAADSAVTWALRQTRNTPREMSIVYQAHDFALNRGRPAEALALTARMKGGEYGSEQMERERVRDALFSDGDSSAGAAAAREIARRVSRPVPTEDSRRFYYFADVCMLERWKLAHGDARTARTSINALRASGASFESMRDGCVLTLEAQLAFVSRSADLRQHVERLDSLLATAPMSAIRDPGNIVVAQLWESLGEPAKALAAVRRREFLLGRAVYLRTLLREEARLARITGDSEGARRALTSLVALQDAAETSIQPAVRRARSELARLTAVSSRS